MIQLPDSTIALGGEGGNGISPTKTDAGKGDTDYWIVRFKLDGIALAVHSVDDKIHAFTVHPNPAMDYIILECLTTCPFEHFSIYDSFGRLAYAFGSTGSESLRIDVSHWPAGFYIWKAAMSEGMVQAGKLMIGQ
jgi:hypothetical protein